MFDPKTLFNFIYDRVNGQIGYTSPVKKPETANGFLPLDSSTEARIVSLLDEKSLLRLLMISHKARFLAAYEITQRIIAGGYDQPCNGLLVQERRNLRIMAQRINWDQRSNLGIVPSDAVNKIIKSAGIILQFIDLNANKSMDNFLRDVQFLKSDNQGKVAAATEGIADFLNSNIELGIANKYGPIAVYLSILADVMQTLIQILKNHPEEKTKNDVITILKRFFRIYPCELEESVVEQIIGIISEKLTSFSKERFGSTEEHDRLDNLLNLLISIRIEWKSPPSAIINSGCLGGLNELIQKPHIRKYFDLELAKFLCLFSWDPILIIDPGVLPSIIDHLNFLLRVDSPEIASLARKALYNLSSQEAHKEKVIAHKGLIEHIQSLIASDDDEITTNGLLIINKLQLDPSGYKLMDKKFMSLLEKKIRNGNLKQKKHEDLATQNCLICNVLRCFLLTDPKVALFSSYPEVNIPKLTQAYTVNIILSSLHESDSDFIKQLFSSLDFMTAEEHYWPVINFLSVIFRISNFEQKTKLLSSDIVIKICNFSVGPHPINYGVIFMLTELFPLTIDEAAFKSKSAAKNYKKALNEALTNYWETLPTLLEKEINSSDFDPNATFHIFHIHVISHLIASLISLNNIEMIELVSKHASSFIKFLILDLDTNIWEDSSPVILRNCLIIRGLVHLIDKLKPGSMQNFFNSGLLPHLLNLVEVLGMDREIKIYHTIKFSVISAFMALYDLCTEEQRKRVLDLSKSYPIASVLIPSLFQTRSSEKPASSNPPLPTLSAHDRDKELFELFGQEVEPKKGKESKGHKKGKAPQTAVASSKGKKLPKMEPPALPPEQGNRQNRICGDAPVDVVALVAKMGDLVVERKSIHYHYDKRVLRWLNATIETVVDFVDYRGKSKPLYLYRGMSPDKIIEQMIHHWVFGVIEELYKAEFKNVWYIEGERGPSFLAYYITVGRDGVRKQQLGVVNFGINRETGNIYHAKFDPLNPGEIPTLIMEEGGEMYEKAIILPPDLDKVSIEDETWTPVGRYVAEKLENGCMQFTYPSSSSNDSSSSLRILPLNYQRNTPAIFPAHFFK